MKTENWTHAEAMIRRIMSYIPARIMYVAAKLGLADQIGDEAQARKSLPKDLTFMQTLCIA